MRLRLPFALALGLAASPVFAENNTEDNCFGFDISNSQISDKLLENRDPEVIRDLADGVTEISSCSVIEDQLRDIADIHEMNDVLNDVDLEIATWLESENRSRFPTGPAIEKLNVLLANLIADEDFMVDDGFFIGTATTLIQTADTLMQQDIATPLISIRPHANIITYLEALALQSESLKQAIIVYNSTTVNYGLQNAFINCMQNRFLLDPNQLTIFKQDYRSLAVKEMFNSDIDPLQETVGSCREFYDQMLPVTQDAVRSYIDRTFIEPTF